MKKTIFVMLLFLGFATANSFAQGFAVGWDLPHVTVKILNNTSDNSFIGPVVDGQQNRTLTPRGAIFQRTFAETAFGVNGPTSIDYEIYACGNVVPVTGDATLNPPSWAMDESHLGNLAITKAFMDDNLNEPKLKERVDAIKHFLNEHQELGRKEKISELNQWSAALRKNGVKQTNQFCGNSQIIHGVIDVSQYNGRRVILITVTGDGTTGYKANIN